jgi:PKD repeat protein
VECRGKIARYRWTFTDGTTAEGPKVKRAYARPGYYSEAVQVSDAAGRIDYDFAIVIAVDQEHRERLPPSLHVVHHPTLGIRPGDEVTLKARTFGTTAGQETWDFGDGSPKAQTRSDGNVVALAKDGYVVVKHRFQKPGHYLVRVERTDQYGQTAVGCVHVAVGD